MNYFLIILSLVSLILTSCKLNDSVNGSSLAPPSIDNDSGDDSEDHPEEEDDSEVSGNIPGTGATCPGGPTVFTDNMNARTVIGQPDFSSNSANQGGSASAQTLKQPLSPFSYNGALYISDTGNNRILIYDQIPTSNNVAADHVIGQPDFTTTTAGTSSTSISGVQGIFVNGDYLATSSWANSRVLLFPLDNILTHKTASIALGQPDFTSSLANQGGGASATTLNHSTSVTLTSDKVIATDATNNRILIYDLATATTGAAAEVVVGQANMTSTSNGSAYNQIGFPLGVSSDGNRLLAIDYGSDRLMIFNSIPTANDASANVIFGVAYGTANDRLKVPVGVFFDGTKIFVADRGNHRVLIWNSLPSADHTLPDVVLGQANLTTGTANPGGVGANTLFDPHFVHYDGCRLFVGDKSNHRVLIY